MGANHYVIYTQCEHCPQADASERSNAPVLAAKNTFISGRVLSITAFQKLLAAGLGGAMEFGVVIRIVGVDADDGMITAAVDVASRGFKGVSRVYTTAEAFEELSSRLRFFPEGPTKSLEFQFGVPGGYGYFSLAFSVLDPTGHCACRIQLESNFLPIYGPQSKNRVEVDMGVEPNAIDRFVFDLQNLLNGESGSAVLEGIAKF